jgi:hypothetical protein
MTTVDNWWRVAANDVPITFLGQPQGEAANVMHRVGGAALAGDRITIVPGVFSEADFLGRVRLGQGCQRRSHGSFSRAIYRTGLSVFRNGPLLRTTNTILRIRTAVRRFLTKSVGVFAAGCFESAHLCASDAISGALRNAIASYAFVVDTKDDKAAPFYQRYRLSISHGRHPEALHAHDRDRQIVFVAS